MRSMKKILCSLLSVWEIVPKSLGMIIKISMFSNESLKRDREHEDLAQKVKKLALQSW